MRRNSRLLGLTSTTAVVTALSTVLVGTAWATEPAPVSDLVLSTKDARVIAHWTASPDTYQAAVCWALNAPPSSPSDVAATCSDALSAPRYDFDAIEGQQYGVSVFSDDAT